MIERIVSSKVALEIALFLELLLVLKLSSAEI